MHAIVRSPAPTLATACELTHLGRVPIDFARIEAQHADYVSILRNAGLAVTVLAALPAYPDSVFVEDAVVLLDDLAILTRPGAASRRDEPVQLRQALESMGLRIAALRPPATLDGGDVLRIGRRLYVGQGTRTNAEGIAQLEALVVPLGLEVVAVALGPSLHLKTAVTALDDETVLVNRSGVDPAVFAGLDAIAVDPSEPFAANVLRLPSALVVNAAFAATRRIVEAHARSRDIPVLAVDIGEFGKAEAGLTCLSVLVP
jgi:dimethylargininase